MLSPQQVGRPHDGQVLNVHVGLPAAGSQPSQVPHQELQGPGAEAEKNPIRLSKTSTRSLQPCLRASFTDTDTDWS